MSGTTDSSVLPNREEARTQWGRWVLQIEGEPAPEELRKVLRQRVAEIGLATPTSWREALAVLDADLMAPLGRPGPSEFDQAFERWLRRALEAFAGDFFEVPVGRRRAVWEEFRQAAAPYPRLIVRLDGLAPGLDVDCANLRERDPRTLALVQQVRGLFSSRPITGAALRRQFLREAARDAVAWEKAARRLRRRHPALAALAPGFIEELSQGKRRVQLRKARVPVPSSPPAAGRKASGAWVILVVAAVLVVRVLTSLDDSTAPRPIRTERFNPPSPTPESLDQAQRALKQLLQQPANDDDAIIIGPDRFRLQTENGRFRLEPIEPSAGGLPLEPPELAPLPGWEPISPPPAEPRPAEPPPLEPAPIEPPAVESMSVEPAPTAADMPAPAAGAGLDLEVAPATPPPAEPWEPLPRLDLPTSPDAAQP